MPLTATQKKFLRGAGHKLEPVVLVGQHGLTPGVIAEMDQALGAHELVKVRARVGDRTERARILSTLAESTRSELVQTIGNVGLFYRPDNELPAILLPDS